MANPRHTRLAPVDDELRIRPIDADSRRQMTLEEKMLRSQIQRERSSAYWFAAAKWGIVGLLIGIAIGGYVMYVASVSTLPLAQDALARGAAIQSAREQLQEAAGSEAAPNAPNAPAKQ